QERRVETDVAAREVENSRQGSHAATGRFLGAYASLDGADRLGQRRAMGQRSPGGKGVGAGPPPGGETHPAQASCAASPEACAGETLRGTGGGVSITHRGGPTLSSARRPPTSGG